MTNYIIPDNLTPEQRKVYQDTIERLKQLDRASPLAQNGGLQAMIPGVSMPPEAERVLAKFTFGGQPLTKEDVAKYGKCRGFRGTYHQERE